MESNVQGKCCCYGNQDTFGGRCVLLQSKHGSRGQTERQLCMIGGTFTPRYSVYTYSGVGATADMQNRSGAQSTYGLCWNPNQEMVSGKEDISISFFCIWLGLSM